jgi:hypothetical protein
MGERAGLALLLVPRGILSRVLTRSLDLRSRVNDLGCGGAGTALCQPLRGLAFRCEQTRPRPRWFRYSNLKTRRGSENFR